jgi:hypothetical protein
VIGRASLLPVDLIVSISVNLASIIVDPGFFQSIQPRVRACSKIVEKWMKVVFLLFSVMHVFVQNTCFKVLPERRKQTFNHF